MTYRIPAIGRTSGKIMPFRSAVAVMVLIGWSGSGVHMSASYLINAQGKTEHKTQAKTQDKKSRFEYLGTSTSIDPQDSSYG
jgi:hypothetical protein